MFFLLLFCSFVPFKHVLVTYGCFSSSFSTPKCWCILGTSRFFSLQLFSQQMQLFYKDQSLFFQWLFLLPNTGVFSDPWLFSRCFLVPKHGCYWAPHHCFSSGFLILKQGCCVSICHCFSSCFLIPKSWCFLRAHYYVFPSCVAPKLKCFVTTCGCFFTYFLAHKWWEFFRDTTLFPAAFYPSNVVFFCVCFCCCCCFPRLFNHHM